MLYHLTITLTKLTQENILYQTHLSISIFTFTHINHGENSLQTFLFLLNGVTMFWSYIHTNYISYSLIIHRQLDQGSCMYVVNTLNISYTWSASYSTISAHSHIIIFQKTHIIFTCVILATYSDFETYP